MRLLVKKQKETPFKQAIMCREKEYSLQGQLWQIPGKSRGHRVAEKRRRIEIILL
jgi:hypothetical protein